MGLTTLAISLLWVNPLCIRVICWSSDRRSPPAGNVR